MSLSTGRFPPLATGSGCASGHVRSLLPGTALQSIPERWPEGTSVYGDFAFTPSQRQTSEVPIDGATGAPTGASVAVDRSPLSFEGLGVLYPDFVQQLLFL